MQKITGQAITSKKASTILVDAFLKQTKKALPNETNRSALDFKN